MSTKAIAVAAAIVLAGVVEPASAAPSVERGEPSFRFSFSHAEFATPAALRGLEARLSREALDYCRSHTSEGLSPVMTYGCRRSVIRAARTALARARAGRG